MPNVRSCADDCVVADFGASFDDCVRLDRHPLSKLRAWINNRAWMNTGCEGDRLRRELKDDLLKGLGWIRNANLSHGNLLGKIRLNEHGGSARFAQESNVFSIH